MQYIFGNPISAQMSFDVWEINSWDILTLVYILFSADLYTQNQFTVCLQREANITSLPNAHISLLTEDKKKNKSMTANPDVHRHPTPSPWERGESFQRHPTIPHSKTMIKRCPIQSINCQTKTCSLISCTLTLKIDCHFFHVRNLIHSYLLHRIGGTLSPFLFQPSASLPLNCQRYLWCLLSFTVLSEWRALEKKRVIYWNA